MTSPSPDGDAGPDTKPPSFVWDWSPKERRQRPTREAFVAAAIHIADNDGPGAVSVRRVAAALSTRPMDLYTAVGRIDDLNDLMVDEVIGGALLTKIPRPWRSGLTAIAHATRDVCVAHPWVLAAAGRRRNVGPNVVRHLEQSLEAIVELDIDSAKRFAIVFAVDTYTLGHVQGGLSHTLQSGQDDPAWHDSAKTHLQRLFASGEFPHLAAYGTPSILTDRYLTPSFDTGLEWLLDGISADIGKGQRASTRTRRPSR